MTIAHGDGKTNLTPGVMFSKPVGDISALAGSGSVRIGPEVPATQVNAGIGLTRYPNSKLITPSVGAGLSVTNNVDLGASFSLPIVVQDQGKTTLLPASVCGNASINGDNFTIRPEGCTDGRIGATLIVPIKK